MSWDTLEVWTWHLSQYFPVLLQVLMRAPGVTRVEIPLQGNGRFGSLVCISEVYLSGQYACQESLQLCCTRTSTRTRTPIIYLHFILHASDFHLLTLIQFRRGAYAMSLVYRTGEFH